MPNVLPDAAGGRTLLVKPGGSLDKPLLGLGGQAKPSATNRYPKKSNSRSIRPMEIQCQFIILARKDEPPPDFPCDTGFPEKTN